MVLNFSNQGDEYFCTPNWFSSEYNGSIEQKEKFVNKKKLRIITKYNSEGQLERITAKKTNSQLVFLAEFQNDTQIKNETYHDNGILAVKTLYNLDAKPILEENYDEYGNIELIKTFSYYKDGNIRSEKIEDESGEYEIRYYKNGQIAYKSKNGRTEEYNEFGLKTKSIDSNGNVTQYKYNENGEKIYELIELKYYL